MKTSNAIINTSDFGSTGRIATGLQGYLLSKGEKCLLCYGQGTERDDDERYKFSGFIDMAFHKINTTLTGSLCCASVLATKRLVRRLRKLNIENVYLVNLHGLYLNERILFDYLVHDHINVVYIMADESAFLGNCFYRNGCEKYKDECKNCHLQNALQKTIKPNAAHRAYQIKRNAYKQLNAEFVAPEFVILSAKESPLLAGCKTGIIDEAIDVRRNAPRDTSALRKLLGIAEDQIVIGCVAPFADPRKGVRYYLEAAKRLENNNKYVFVQVGYNVNDKSNLPKNYIPIGFVNDGDLLAEYYSLADLFVFPSLADTMPNACLEALACGSPLLCFNVSGMPFIGDETVMSLVSEKDVDRMVEAILKTPKKDDTIINICRNYALQRYDNQKYFEKLYKTMSNLR